MVEAKAHQVAHVGRAHLNAGFLVVGQAQVVGGAFGAARHRNVVGLVHGVAAKHPVLPIDERRFLVLSQRVAVEIRRTEPRFEGAQAGTARLRRPFVGVFQVVGGLEHVERPGNIAHAKKAVVGHDGFTGLAIFGGDDDHAVGPARTVNSRRRGIFQHVNRLNILRREHGQRIFHLHPIHYVERRVVLRYRAAAPHPNADIRAGRAFGGRYLHPGQPAGQCLSGRVHRNILDLLGIHRSHRAGHVLTLNGLETNNHHVIELLNIGSQYHVNSRFIGHSYLFRHKPHVAKPQFGASGARGQGDGVAPIGTGRSTVGGAFYQHGHAGQGFSLSRFHNAQNLAALGHRHPHATQKQQPQQNKTFFHERRNWDGNFKKLA